MLHLGGGISLRVDVADLLELEGTFERHREIHAASQVEKVGLVGVALGERFHLRLEGQRAAHQLRQLRQPAHDLPPLLLVEPALTAQVEAEHHQGHDLGGKRLGGRHADLRARVQIDAAVRLPGDRAAHYVDDAHDARSRGARRAHRLERVRSLARLRDGDRQRPGQRELSAVAVLRGVLDLDGDSRELLDHLPPHQAGVP